MLSDSLRSMLSCLESVLSGFNGATVRLDYPVCLTERLIRFRRGQLGLIAPAQRSQRLQGLIKQLRAFAVGVKLLVSGWMGGDALSQVVHLSRNRGQMVAI